MKTKREKVFHILGRVVEKQTHNGIADLRVETWDKDLLVNDMVGSAVTDDRGSFQIEFRESFFRELFLDRTPDLFFKVYRGDKCFLSTEDSPLWNVRSGDTDIVIEIDLKGGEKEPPSESTRPYTPSIRGSVLSTITGDGVSGLTVEAWDKDLVIKSALGRATTGEEGRFELTIETSYYQEIRDERRPDVFFKVYGGGILVTSTEESVLWNANNSSHQVTISVALVSNRETERPQVLTIRGRIAKPDGTPLTRIRVVATQPAQDGKARLGVTLTDTNGHYAISYSPDMLLNPAKGSADFVVSAYQDGTDEPVASSPLILNALPDEVINLSVGEESYRGRSEYEVVAERVQPLITNRRLTDISAKDIALIGNQTELDVQQVQIYVESKKQAEQAVVQSQLLYALYRTGMPYSLAVLTIQNPDKVDASLKQAQEQNLIAPIGTESRTRFVEWLKDRSAKELLAADSPGRIHAASLMEIANIPETEQVAALQVYATNPESTEKFWEALKSADRMNKDNVARLQRVFEFNALSLGHLPLVQKLSATKEIRSVKDLASRDAAAWKEFLTAEKIEAPDLVPGVSVEERRNNYALLLARIVEDSYPTAVFVHRWKALEAIEAVADVISDTTPAGLNVTTFFERNPDFAFESQGINTYLDQHPQALEGIADKKESTLKLQAVQNLFRIAPRFDRAEAVRAMWQDNLRSSHDIKRMGEEKFVAKYAARMGKSGAQLAFRQAEKAANLTLLTLAKYAWDANAITPYVIPKTDLTAYSSGQGREAISENKRATLESLFGNLDFCHCEDCRSVLGPAAYLVDLLMFLNNAEDKNKKPGLETLFARRPDIGNIKLSCDNTKTKIPYIDLVNEVLEDTIEPRTYQSKSVTPKGASAATTLPVADVYQTEEKRSEYLRAHPEHLNTKAYDKVKTASYSWMLPFNLFAEEARTYLGQLDVKRHYLMEVFTGLSGSKAKSPTETEVMCEALSLTPLERKLLKTVERDKSRLESKLKELWGVNESESLVATVQKVSSFLKRAFPKSTGLKFKHLEELLQCRFVNPPNAKSKITIVFNRDHPCSLDHAKLREVQERRLTTDLSLRNLDRLHRFIRLRHKLGWDFFDLDRAFTAFSKKEIDDDLLRKLSEAIQLKEKLSVSLRTVLSWWSSTVDTISYKTDGKDIPSQYDDLFLNPAVGNLKDEQGKVKTDDEVINTLTLKRSADGSVELSLPSPVPKMTAEKYVPVILGAAGIRKDDLDLIINEDLGQQDVLSLANLSHVYRVASFARAIGLKVAEYYILRKLSGLEPLSLPSTPSTTAMPKQTHAFLKAKEAVEDGALSLAELAYLLAHDTTHANSGQLAAVVQTQRLNEIRTELAAVYDEYQMPSESLDTALKEWLGKVLPSSEALLKTLEKDTAATNVVNVVKASSPGAIAMEIVLGNSKLTEAEQGKFIETTFSEFLDPNTAKTKLKPTTLLTSPERSLTTAEIETRLEQIATRLEYVLESLLSYYYPREARRRLEQKLAESLSITVGAASAILDVIKDPTDATNTKTTKDVFLDDSFVTSTDEISAASMQYVLYERLYKASRVASAVKTKEDDQKFLIRYGSSVGWLDVNILPLSAPVAATVKDLFGGYSSMVKAFAVWPRVRTSGAPLSEFLTATTKASDTDDIEQELEDNTTWSQNDIKTLVDNYGFTKNDLQKTDWLVTLYKAFTILKQIGVSASQAWSWNTADVTSDQATQIKQAAKSKYTSKEWLSVAPQLRDPLREKQRDALLDYVIHYTFRDKGFIDADDVYAYLLIDPQMSARMDTSRIRQAISSVQLFVQRILMNLEENEIEFTYAEAKQWKWRKNYRVWEANRKVFLWPENWIYPELRDDKSPFFKELEDEISSGDLDDDLAESALMSYLKKLDEVANLEVAGLYDDTDDTGRNVLHVVARTRSTPHKYFYRRRMKKQYWTAWERIEADIEGDHLIPVVHNRRLFLFWPKFMEKAQEPSSSDMTVTLPVSTSGSSSVAPPSQASPLKYYEIRIAWTQFRDGKWYETSVSTDYLQTSNATTLRSKEEFYFFSETDALRELVIRCGLIPANEWESATGYAFFYSDGTDSVEVRSFGLGLPAGWGPNMKWYYASQNMNLNKLPDGDNKFMEFEKNSNEDRLDLLSAAQIDYFGSISTKTTKTLLEKAETDFQVMLPQQYPTYISQSPLFYEDSKRAFFIEPTDVGYPLFLWPYEVAFAVPANAYFRDVKEKLLDIGPIPITPPLPAERVRRYFNDERPYYVGNSASEWVIDRAVSRPSALLGSGVTALSRYAAVRSPASTGLPPVSDLMRLDDTSPPQALRTFETDIQLQTAFTAVEKTDFYNGLAVLGYLATDKQYRFRMFDHPYVPLMIMQLNRYGVEGLLAPTTDHGTNWSKLKRQQIEVDKFQSTYSPGSGVVDTRYPKADFDFDFGGAYSQYNWELFFHAPLLIADRLVQNQQFDDARKWFHYIFDPTETEGTAPARFWKIKPFYEYDGEASIEKLMDLLNKGDEEMEAQVEAWEEDPFNPHLIARMRIVAYMRATVQKYLDYLIAHGDYLFTQDTMESTNEAAQIYTLAAQILGRRPERVKKQDVSESTFNTLFPTLDRFSNAKVDQESRLPWMTSHSSETSSGATGVLDTLYFCIPQNETLLSYWDTVEDRLYKLRNCLNIEGVARTLELFEAPIDPGLLVKARAGGLELSSVLADLNASLPHYRFRVVLQRAIELCNDARNLGGALLQALEKRDESKLALLRATNQEDWLDALRDVKEAAKEETEYQKKALQERQQLAKIRKDYYESLDFMSPLETVGMELHAGALVPHAIGTIGEMQSAVLTLLPAFETGASGFGGSPHFTMELGPENFAGFQSHLNSFFLQLANGMNSAASIVNTLASYQRRQEEWKLQIKLADQEIDELDEQIEAAQARIDLAEADLDAHDKQIENAKAEADFLESRFTNKDLYGWLVTQISTLYFQMYKMAYDMAKKAEQCMKHELGISATKYIQYGYWDSLKKGLLAGERLMKDIRRLENAYLEKNRREQELTKHVSLVHLDPVALMQLRETGKCEFTVPEVLFDLDQPGHYMRRIKTVSLSVPCIVGPYTSVGAKLTLLKSRVRTKTSKSTEADTSDRYVYKGTNDDRFAHDPIGIQSIATSSAQQDAGIFELNFGDERYFPFEGGGAISQWRLELPDPTKFQQFDYRTITDVILHIRYTARDGGDTFKKDVENSLVNSLNKFADILAESQTGLKRSISMAHEFSTEWHRFMYPDKSSDKHELTLKLDKRLFPFMLKDRSLEVKEIKAVLLLDNVGVYSDDSGDADLPVDLTYPDGDAGAKTSSDDDTGTKTSSGNLKAVGDLGNQPAFPVTAAKDQSLFKLQKTVRSISLVIDLSKLSKVKAETFKDLIEQRDSKNRLNPNEVKDLVFLFTYTIAK